MSALVLKYTFPTSGFALTLPISTTDGTLTSVDWGDLTTPDTSYTHTYTDAGEYIISITGSGITQLSQNFSTSTAAGYLTECSSFGEIGLTNLSSAFYQCTSLTTVPTSLPVNTNVTNMYQMFRKALLFNQDISTWDFSTVENMSYMFFGGYNQNSTFNQDITSWDVSNVTDMSYMFYYNNAFNNGDTGNNGLKSLTWGNKTSNVTNMSGMFGNATAFNQDISDWNVSSVTDMNGMFDCSSAGTGNSSIFNNGDTTNTQNKPLSWSTGTGTTNVTSMYNMFNSASVFNQDLDTWTVSSVTSIFQMFNRATAFNGNITNWVFSTSLTGLGGMFNNASAFNQDISGWDVSNITGMTNMLDKSGISVTNYDNILIGWAQLSVQSGVTLGAAGLIYSSAGETAHNTLDSYWNFNGDAIVSTDEVIQGTSFDFTINSATFSSGSYYLTYSGLTSSTVTYAGNVGTIEFTNLKFTTFGSNQTIVLNTPLTFLTYTYYLDVTEGTSSYVCFKEDTKILTDHGYIPIQYLRKGDLIQTFRDGFVPINMIGKKEIHNPAIKERIKDQLYTCSQDKYPEVFEDLVITGCHSILVKGFKDDEERENTIRINGNTYVTDDHYRLPSCVDNRASVYEKEGTYTIYHVALDHDNYLMNYGIYANGLLVESCSQRYIKELSGMTLI